MGLFDSKEKKPKPDFSNVRSGGSSTAPAPDSQADGDATPAKPVAGTYIVVAGDSLSRIAKRHYGDANDWPRIYDANRDVIKDPNLIHPGQQLRIP
jgi:nucleoid-associated protein YgaU